MSHASLTCKLALPPLFFREPFLEAVGQQQRQQQLYLFFESANLQHPWGAKIQSMEPKFAGIDCMARAIAIAIFRRTVPNIKIV